MKFSEHGSNAGANNTVASTQFPNLPVATGLTGAEIVPIVQAGTSARTTVGAIALFADFGVSNPPAILNGMSTIFGLSDAGLISQISATNIFQQGNQTAVAGSKIKIEKLIEASGDPWPLENEGGIWTGTTYAFSAISKTFDSSYATVPNASPTGAFWVYANNDGAPGDVVALMADVVVRQAGGVGFGANIIARDNGVNAKLVGMEIDLEFSATGSVAPGSGGLYINVFNKTNAGPAIQLGGLGGGKFTNGIILDAIVGTGLAPNSGSVMTSLINTGAGVFSDAAVIFSNVHKLKLSGTASAHGYLYMDASNNERLVLGSGLFAIRNNADNASLFTFQAAGIASAAAWDASVEFRVAGTKVVGARDTGWAAMTGTANKNTAYDTATVTLPQLAGRMMALQAALTTTGLIGT